MATVYRVRKGEPVFVGDGCPPTWATTAEVMGPGIEQCSLCGSKLASAYWMGLVQLSVCKDCAVHDLPKLVADALVGERRDVPGTLPGLHRDLAIFQKCF